MIKLDKPFAGWMGITIGDESFTVSYLSDVFAELDYLFNLNDDMHVNRIRLEGESAGDIYLTAYTKKCGKELVIVWHDAYSDDDAKVMSFDRDAFLKEYQAEKDAITPAVYDSEFMMEKEYAHISDVDNFLYDYAMLLEKYPDVSFDVREEYDYDHDDEPYLSGYYLEAVNYKTGEHRYVEGD